MHQTFTRSHLKEKYKNLISTLNYTQSHQTLLRCSYCSFETDDGTKMVEHSNNHTDVNSKVYQCRECWYSTNDANCYRGHMGIHSNWRPQKCMSCSFSCKRRYSLRRHQKTVHASGRKLLQCPLCSYVNVNQRLITSHYKDAPDYIAVMCATIRVIQSVISNYIQLFTFLIGLTNVLSVHILQKQSAASEIT